jgi:tRNA(fMet)-specific endonuclease VapC
VRRLLDTSVCVDALRRRGDAERRLRAFDPSELVLSVITVLELRVSAGLVGAGLVGADLVSARARDAVDSFTSVFDVLPVTGETVERSADVRVRLRRQGKALGDFDLLIAATALVYDYALLTRDRDFLAVPGLRVEEWLA